MPAARTARSVPPPDPTLEQALALLDEWEATPEHAERHNLNRYADVHRYVLSALQERPAALDASLIPLA